MATEIDGIIYTNERYSPWTKWKRCVMIQQKTSIANKIIWGLGWSRERNIIFIKPAYPGQFYNLIRYQFAKTKQEIFLQKLKENN